MRRSEAGAQLFGVGAEEARAEPLETGIAVRIAGIDRRAHTLALRGDKDAKRAASR